MQVSFVVPSRLRGDRIFRTDDAALNRDGCLEQFGALRRRFRELGATIATDDLVDPATADAVIYLNAPAALPQGSRASRSFLLFLESPIIRPGNYRREAHERFRKIFTNADDLVDGERYIKVNYAFEMPQAVPVTPLRDRKFCALIAANKRSAVSGELYSERLAAIRWFERTHPEAFDLYGRGWDEAPAAGLMAGVVRRLPRSVRRAIAERHVAYRGPVESKREVLSRYRFSIAYENVGGVRGYITEKLFDCLFAGCIPVYLGAPNIGQYVDPACYIDRSAYRDYHDLYEHMAALTEKEYRHRVAAINSYLHTALAGEFSAEHFAETVADHVFGL